VEFFENLDIVNMVGGEHHTIALDSEGNVYATGRNDDG
jgi:regulator of chromosome condensation